MEMRIYKKKVISAFAAVAAILVLTAASAMAGIALRQPSVKLFLDQGQNFSGGILLENTSDKDVNVRAELVDRADSEGRKTSHSASSWIKLANNDITVPAKSVKDLGYTISVPKSAEGGYYTAIVYSHLSGDINGPDGSHIQVNMNIESPVEVLVKGTVKNDLKISGLNAEYSAGTLKFEADLTDSGNCFYEVRPTFLVVDTGGAMKKALKPEKIKMFPGEERKVSYQGKADLPGGRLSLLAVFDIDGSEPFTAEKAITRK